MFETATGPRAGFAAGLGPQWFVAGRSWAVFLLWFVLVVSAICWERAVLLAILCHRNCVIPFPFGDWGGM